MPKSTRRASRLIAAALPLALLIAVGCKEKEETPAPPPTTTHSQIPSTTSPTTGASESTTTTPTSSSSEATPAATSAEATIEGVGANKDKITGTVTFKKTDDGVRVMADVAGLSPGKHGFHIHENAPTPGDETLKSTGGHFNPTHMAHGGPETEPHHAGDLGNLTADDSGHAKLDEVIKGVSLAGESATDGIVGRSVVIHAGEDDLKSNPAGNSGGRIAFGVIKAGGGATTQP